jgi:hypothetical protein
MNLVGPESSLGQSVTLLASFKSQRQSLIGFGKEMDDIDAVDQLT